jgi:hypothetical protein
LKPKQEIHAMNCTPGILSVASRFVYYTGSVFISINLQMHPMNETSSAA